MKIISKAEQAYGAFNNGEIVENKPIGFPQDGGKVKPYSNLFYWAYAEANTDSEIGLHPHKGFEIMSFVLKGNIRHFDTKLNEWRNLSKGDAQIIRAGSGISHAEFLEKDSAIFQIWLDPNIRQTMEQEATYDDYKVADFPVRSDVDVDIVVYSGTSDAPMTMDTPNVKIERWTLKNKSTKIELETNQQYSLYVLSGTGNLNGSKISQDDFIILDNEDILVFDENQELELFVIDSPKVLDYATYGEMMQQRFRS